MILETIRMVTDALKDSVYGVNAQLAALPKDSDDPTPPNVDAVLDTTRDDAAARGDAGPENVVLVVSSESADVEGQSSQAYIDGRRVPIVIRYFRRDGDTADAVRDGLYTMRAVLRTIHDLMRLDTGSAARNRNSIQLVSCQSQQFGEVTEQIQGGAVVAAWVGDFYVRDTVP